MNIIISLYLGLFLYNFFIKKIKESQVSDIQLKSEINNLVDKSGYEKSKDMMCPIIKILTMRHKDVSSQQIYKVAKSIF